MRWRQASCGVLLFLAAVASLWGADPALPGYLPPGTRVVFGVRMRSLMDAFAAKGFSKEAQEAFTKSVAQSPLGGIDVFHDLDEFWFATAGVDQNPPFLAVMTGRFNESGFSSGGSRYRGGWILANKQNPQQALAWVDAGTVLAGDLPLVRAALDRGAAAAHIDPALAARAAALRGKYDIWGAGNPVPGPKLAGAAEPLSSVDRFDFGMAFTHGLECEAELHVRSPQDLEKLTSSLRMLEMLMSAQPANRNAGHLDLRTQNGGVHVAISIPEEELMKAVDAQRTAITAALASQLGGIKQAAPVVTHGATPASAAPTSPRPVPTGQVEVITNARGETVSVKLP